MSDVTNELIPMQTLKILDDRFEIVDAKARSTKLDLPLDSEGNVDLGEEGQVLTSDGYGGYTWAKVETEVTRVGVEEALGYTPAKKSELDKLSPLYTMNGCIVCNGEEITLVVGEDVEVGQEITFRYKSKDGYTYSPTLSTSDFFSGGGSNSNPMSTNEYEESSIVIAENWRSVNFTGAYFVLVKPSAKPDEDPITWDDIENKPDKFPPSEHNHDGSYATPEYVNEAVQNVDSGLTEETVRTLINEILLSDAKAKNPVGTILFSTQNVNPSTYMGFGTWVPWGSGRVPVGVDDTDENFALVEQTGGASTHKLTVSEIPAHDHTVWARSVYSGTGSYIGLCNQSNSSTSYVTGDRGGGKEHNNLQPYITCYMWKRTD